MFAVFPYLKTSEPVRFRSITLWPIEESSRLPANAVSDLETLRSMFFLQSNQKIQAMSYAFCADDAADTDLSEFLGDLYELRELLAYLYSSPHESLGDPFLRNEHSSFFLMRPKRFFRTLIDAEYNAMQLGPDEHPQADERGEVAGFECEVDGRSTTWVTTGSRIYPPCVRLWLNISQDLRRDTDRLPASGRYGPVWSYFLSRRGKPSELYGRLLTALRWYNRSIGVDTSDDAALVHLATALESLLALEQGPDITRRFKAAVMLLIGNVPRADIWLDQFYRARSEIVHRGEANALRFNPYHGTKGASEEGESGYRSLLSYGWFIFQICAAAVSSGALVARNVGLESMLLTNRQRLERVSKVLSSKEPAGSRLSAVAKDIADIDRYRFVGEPGLTVDHLLGAVKLVASCYIEAVPDDTSIAKELQDLADAKTSQTLDALHRLRLLNQKIEDSSWTAGGRPDDPRYTVATLVHSAWYYTFMTYFHLKDKGASSSE